MSQTSTTPPNDLSAIIAEALRAYELARAAYLRDPAIVEQERSGQLLANIQQVKEAARDLLEKAGLAHIVGVPLNLDGTVPAVRRADERVSAAFAAAQLAIGDLRASLLQLARAYTDASHWEEAQRVLQPLLRDTTSLWYADALDLWCETYYISSVAALDRQEWTKARQGFEVALNANASYQDAANLLRESYLRPARLALGEQQFDKAQEFVNAWLTQHKDDVDARNLLCDIYLLLIATSIQTENWSSVQAYVKLISQLNPNHIGISALLKIHPYLAWSVGQVCAIDNTLEIWNSIMLHGLSENYSPDRQLSLLPAQEQVKMVDLASGRILYTVSGHYNSWMQSVAFSPNRQLLACKGNKGVELWDIAYERLLYTLSNTLDGRFSEVRSVVFSPDGKLLASGSNDMCIKVWDIISGQVLYSESQCSNSVWSVVFSPNGQLLALCDARMGVRMWDVTRRQVLRTLHGPPGGHVNSVAFSADGKLLASGSHFGQIQLWDVSSGRELHTFRHTGGVTGVTFSPDGRLLGTIGDNETNVWEPRLKD